MIINQRTSGVCSSFLEEEHAGDGQNTAFGQKMCVIHLL